MPSFNQRLPYSVISLQRLIYYFIHRYNQLHFSNSQNSITIDMCQVNGWEALPSRDLHV